MSFSYLFCPPLHFSSLFFLWAVQLLPPRSPPFLIALSFPSGFKGPPALMLSEIAKERLHHLRVNLMHFSSYHLPRRPPDLIIGGDDHQL